MAMQLKKYSKEAKELFVATQKLAKSNKHQALEPEHLLSMLLVNERVGKFIEDAGGDLTKLRQLSDAQLDRFPKVSGASNYLSPRFIKLMSVAEVLPARFKTDKVELEQLLFCFADPSIGHGPASTMLKEAGLTKEALEKKLGRPIGDNPPDSKDSSKEESVLEQCSEDLIEKAKQGKIGPIVGRSGELRRVIQVLCRSIKNNPILIGQPGVGKTAIVEALAIRMAQGDVPAQLKGRRLLTLDLSSLVAGASLRGQFEERLKKVVDEVKRSDGQIVLFVDEVHSMVSGSDSNNDAASLLKPALARGEVQIFGATTPDEYRNSIEKDKALDRRFQSILVEEPTSDQTLSILRGVKSRFENTHGVKIQDPALNAAITLSKRYIPSRNLPDKAIDLIDEAASRLRIELDSVPTEIDELQRRIAHFKMELLALQDQNHESTLENKARLQAQVSEAVAEMEQLQSKWENENRHIQNIRALNTQIADTTRELETSERAGDLEYAAQIKFGVLHQLQADLNEAVAELDGIRVNGRLLREEIHPEDIASVVADVTGIPVSTMMESEREKLVRMEEEISKEVVGQKEALNAIATAVRRSRAGLNDPNRPVGSFFFLGPTGCGKTQLAKALTRFLFDDEANLIRLDMSEFMEKHTVARLIGAPPGYKGADEGGQLTEAVRLKPYSVVLFDEVEKGHPDVFNVLLQILDDGRLSDSQGRLVDFKNTVIIMTSNVGSHHLLESTLEHGHVTETAKDSAMNNMRETFRPEFLGRIDEIIMFHGLTKENIEDIADIHISNIEKLLAAKKLSMEFTSEAKAHVVELGFQPAYGARPLRRALQKYLQDPLSMEILQDKFEADDVILVGVQDGELIFDKKES